MGDDSTIGNRPESRYNAQNCIKEKRKCEDSVHGQARAYFPIKRQVTLPPGPVQRRDGNSFYPPEHAVTGPSTSNCLNMYHPPPPPPALVCRGRIHDRKTVLRQTFDSIGHDMLPKHNWNLLPQPPPPPPRPPPRESRQKPDLKGKKGKFFTIKINNDIVKATTPGDVLSIVRESDLELFDGINISTALHKLASFDAKHLEVESILNSSEFKSLVAMIPPKASFMAVRNISNIMWAFARLSPKYCVDSELLDCLTYRLHLLIDQKSQCVPQNISNSLWAMATLNYAPLGSVLSSMEREIMQMLPKFTSQNLSNVVLSFAKLGYSPSEGTMKGLTDHIYKIIHSFSAQALSNTIWGLSKLGYKDHKVYGVILQASVHKLETFSPQNLALSFWGFANIGYDPGNKVVAMFADASKREIEDFSAQNITNIMWSLAKMGIDHPVFDLLANRAASLAKEFSPQTYGNLVWSFAHIQKQIPENLLSAIFLCFPRFLEHWAPQNLTNTVWGLVVLRQDSGQSKGRYIVEKLNNEIERRLSNPSESNSFTSQNLSNYFWALGIHHDTLRTLKPGSCDCFMNIFLSRIHEFKPQELANVCLSCARLDYFDANIFDKIADVIVSRMCEFEGQHLSNVILAFGKLRHANRKLLTSVSLSAEAKLATFSYQDIGNILWTVAILNFDARLLISRLSREILHRITVARQNVEPSQLSNIIWSLSISNAIDTSTWGTLIERLDFSNLGDDRREICSRIYQSQLILRARNGINKSAWVLPNFAQKLCQDMWRIATKDVTISDFHMKVSQVLDLMGEKHVVEYLTEDGNFSIDIAMVSEKIAIEIDGPQHFTRTNDFLGDTLARNEILRAHGWHVISIPFYAWTSEIITQKQLLEHALGNTRQRIM